MNIVEINKNKPPDYFKCIKVPIKHILKNPEINASKINNAVMKCNKITIHTLLFMKLYLLDYYEKNNKLPNIDKVFVNSCMKILCNENASGRPPSKDTKELKDKLTIFYDKEYKPLIQNDPLDYTHLNTVLDYMTISIITMYENNIKLHYVEYIERYVNVVWKKKFMIEKIRKIFKTKKERDNRINKLCNELRKIKNDLLNVSDDKYKSKSLYHQWIKDVKKKILPNKTKYMKDNLYYDIQCNPQDYLPCMIIMMKEIEKDGLTINNVFPMRNTIISSHCRIDTTTLVHLLMTKKQGNKTDYLLEGNLKKYEDKIWKFFFRTERQCFNKPNYTFHHMIETDGISCSIIMIRTDLIGKRIPTNKIGNTEEYIDELKDYTNIINKKIVAYDPGMGDIIFCVDSDNKDANEFRYTQDSRRKECKIKKYAKLILGFKKEKIEGKTIIEYETEISTFNKKTLDIKEFKKYIQKKCEINHKLFKFYENYIFRKLKLNGYINRKKNEQKMISNFAKIFGKPSDVVICAGDWEQKQHMKYKEPTKGISIRKLFRQNGYKLYLVDEFRTSCKCSKCEGGKCEKFMVRENPKPYKNNNIVVHGLLTCKKCSGVWNRDVNGATNIYKIAKNAIKKEERPKYLCRDKKETDIKTTEVIIKVSKKKVSKKSVVLDDTTKS
jgi:hypothetical protein